MTETDFEQCRETAYALAQQGNVGLARRMILSYVETSGDARYIGKAVEAIKDLGKFAKRKSVEMILNCEKLMG